MNASSHANEIETNQRALLYCENDDQSYSTVFCYVSQGDGRW